MEKIKIMIARESSITFPEMEKVLKHEGCDVSVMARDFRGAASIDGAELVIVASAGIDEDDGIRLIEKIRRFDETIPIVLVTRHSSEKKAVAALRAGADDYFKAPFSERDLVDILKCRLDRRRSRAKFDASPEMIGKSKVMEDAKSYLCCAALADSTILITGETGTGKELAAAFLHMKSKRRHRPFICVNCAAVPESLVESELFGYERGAFTGAFGSRRGKFELADGGTVFLDEIAEMSPFAQAKILRAIESKQIARLGGKHSISLDFRIAAATNRDPERLVEEGKFREDLYYRLNVGRLHIPPLRERKEDIPLLAAYAVEKLNERFGKRIGGVDFDVLERFLRYPWPGNVRELMNVLESSFLNPSGDLIGFGDLPAFFRKKLEEISRCEATERDMLLSTLVSVEGNKSEAARKLGWSRMTLYRKMKKFKIG